MSATRTITLACNTHPDGPPASFVHTEPGGIRGARTAAAADGWRSVNNKYGVDDIDICPACIERLSGKIVELDADGKPKLDADGEPVKD